MSTKKGKAKPRMQPRTEVLAARERWEQNAQLSAKEGYYIEAQLARERAQMLRWVLNEEV